MTFPELCQELNIPYAEEGDHEHARSGWVQIDCPYCSPGWEHYRLGYNTRFGNCNCWGCGPKGLVDALHQSSGHDVLHVKALVRTLERGESLPGQGGRRIERVRGTLRLPENKPLSGKQRLYLEARGFDPEELVRLWDLRGIGMLPRKYAWRILIPIYLGGSIVSFTTRSTKRTGLRYLSASPAEEIWNHKWLLYGEDYLRQAVVVVEGPTGVWRLGPGTVCTFGTSWTTSHVERIAKYPVRAICYDSEPGAQRRAAELVDVLAPFPGKTMRLELDAADPGKAKRREIRAIRRHILGDRFA